MWIALGLWVLANGLSDVEIDENDLASSSKTEVGYTMSG